MISFEARTFKIPFTFVLMGILLGIDFGLKRTGLALTDDLKMIASPLEMVASEKLMQRLESLVVQYKIDGIVLGYPLSLDGTFTDVTQNVLYLKEAIEKQFVNIPIYLQNEQYTSKRASQAIFLAGKKKDLKNKGLVDKISAAILLQDYLAHLAD
jgi:putative Holliday junction resolvase